MIRPPLARALALALLFASPSFAQTPTDSGGGPIRKKLIELGWGDFGPARFLENLAQIEQTPFDGITLRVDGTDAAGKPVSTFQTCIPKPWKREWFQQEIDTLKKIKSAKLTNNFVRCSLSVSKPDFVDAFDDDGWKIIVDHFRTVAWLAKEGGLRGLMFDPEGYGATVINTKSSAHPEKSFEEYAAQVRKRGREVMAAMAKEYPDMVFFTLFMNAGTALGALGDDPREGLAQGGRYALYPAFVNGWLDAAPPTLTIVDGFEPSYPHSDEAQYLKHVNAMRNTTLALVSPENRFKFRAQVQAGLAIYLDAFVGAARNDVHSDVYTDPPLEGRLVDRLQQATSSALDAADEYVWVFNEQYRWWPDGVNPEATRYWEEILPGITKALDAARDPAQRGLLRAEKEFAVMEKKMATRGNPMRNLVVNGDFLNGAASTAYIAPFGARNSLYGKEPVKDWETALKDKGTAQRGRAGCASPGSACLAGAAEAMYFQKIKANPGRYYKLRAFARQSGEGEASLRAVREDAEGKELGAAQSFTPQLSPRDEWVKIEGTVHAPAGAANLVLQLVAKGQPTEKEIIWFDDAQVYTMSVN